MPSVPSSLSSIALQFCFDFNMPRKMAVTHADLEPGHSRIDLRSKTGACLVILTILLGFVCFTLCLVAEATRSEAMYKGDEKGGKNSVCVYNDSGKVPLLCAACAFVGLAIAMVVEHAYLMISVSKSPALLSWEPDSSSARFLTWQTGFLFISTWICFAVGEILLLAGVSVESGHLRNWNNPRTTCLVIKQGLFAAAGVFALTTVLLESALYLTAVRAQKVSLEQENVRRQVLETSALYSSPVTSPRTLIMPISTMPRENPIPTIENQASDHLLSVFPTPFNKTSRIL
ncbi:uncharacterized protein LOC129310142 [Prosopis cineraria]|uniref:uncharacterized protein LOC129310142 n=1 Tax=Prosopis cineraria TaxID=364024 RepID=UPI00240F70A5|nr:uncharacterized protein LOC129310142 [Prosopis cineraria]